MISVKTSVTCGGCEAKAIIKVSYMEEMILLAADILQEVLSADLKGLEKTVVFVEGKESGKKGQQSLANPAGNSKITSTPSASSQERCRFSKRSGHGSNPGEAIRKSSSPAWNDSCHKCVKKGHFKAACKRARLSPQTCSLCLARRRKER